MRTTIRQGARLALLVAALAPVACAQSPVPHPSRKTLADAVAAEAARLQPAAKAPGSARGGQMDDVQRALHAGRPLLALDRLADARVKLVAGREGGRWPAVATPAELARFETSWDQAGAVLGAMTRPAPGGLSGVQPALARARAEMALLRVHGYYVASLDYARATDARSGAYYLGEAQGEHELAGFLRQLPAAGERPAPPLRSVAPDIDALEREVLAAYRPPASIELHPRFIATSAAIGEARQLDQAGFRDGALLRFLQAARAAAAVTPASPPSADLRARLRTFDARLATGGADHSIGQLFAQAAAEDLEPSGDAADDATRAADAAAIVERVLPLYVAALAPSPAEAPRPPPLATITLVRWPYT